MRKEDLIPGAPALCEYCGEQIRIAGVYINQEAYIEVFRQTDREIIEVICLTCEELSEQSSIEWDSINDEILDALESIEKENTDQQ